MRVLLDVEFPVEPFNAAVRDGSASAKMQKIMAAVKPEAAYFTARNGKRGGTIVVNLNDPSEIPALAEPFFLTFNASVTILPCMTPEDLGRSNLDGMAKLW
jgi:hypothetical protein